MAAWEKRQRRKGTGDERGDGDQRVDVADRHGKGAESRHDRDAQQDHIARHISRVDFAGAAECASLLGPC